MLLKETVDTNYHSKWSNKKSQNFYISAFSKQIVPALHTKGPERENQTWLGNYLFIDKIQELKYADPQKGIALT